MTFSVHILSGCRAGTTFEYRVLQKQEQLASQGIPCTVGEVRADEERWFRTALEADLLLLYRVAYSPRIEALIEQARGRGIPVLFDVDDLVFEPEVVARIDPVKAMGAEQAVLYYQGVWRYRWALQASDVVLTSTAYLAQRAEALGRKAYVHRNGLSGWMLDEAERLRQKEPSSSADKVIIGYGSGTATHRRDFAEAAPALAEVMRRHPEVELLVVGALHPTEALPLPESLRPFRDRIRYHPPVAWREWLTLQQQFDINLAPLELGNPYCESKSELKYIEAAIVGVPTVASRTPAFEFAIADGETGFLAGDEAEWVEKLERLVVDADLRGRMGEAARNDVLRRYHPRVLGERLQATLVSVMADYQRQRQKAEDAQAPLILNWIFPEPIPGSGGHRDIVRMINLLADFGHHVNAYVVPRQQLWNKSDQEIRAFVERYFGPLHADLFKWAEGVMEESDVVMLTHWSTAYLVDDVKNTSRIFYFVQDWEPFFFPMGTEYLRAEQTYKMGFSCITLGRWLTKRLREWYGADADYFDLAVDHSIYYPREVERPAHPRLCFYARPSTPRRLFPIGIEALQKLHQRRPDVEIILYGSQDKELKAFDIPFPYTNMGILDEEGLAELFSTCDVGIVLSPTNCSLVPPEMMACRCAVVDLNRETVMGVMENGVNALLAEPTPDAIAEAALRLLEDEPLRERLVETAYRQMQARSWSKSARKIESILVRKLPPLRRVLLPRHRESPPALPSLDELPADQQRRLLAVHRQRRRGWKPWVAIWRDWLREGARSWRLNGSRVYTVGEIRGRRRITQTFTARRDGLYRVDLLVGTYGRINTRDVVLALWRSSDGHQVATARINAGQMLDRHYVSFTFSPQRDSGGKSYAISVESPTSVPGDAITLWAYHHGQLPGLSLSRNGRRLKGHLAFGLFYRDGETGSEGERPLLCCWDRSPTLRQHLRKSWQILRQKGVLELWQEIVNYIRWQWQGL